MPKRPVLTSTAITYLSAALLAVCACAWVNALGSGGPAETAQAILDETGIEGGIIVHLGCGDGRLTAALRVSDRYTVHGLDADAANVEAARRRIERSRLYGPVSVEQFSGRLLPYADNLIDLVVAEGRSGVSKDEIMRVLAPGGVAYLKDGDEWTKTVKPRPGDIDEWSHFLHDAGNNAVAQDSVGPPHSLRWVAPPLWLRSHETPSGIEGLVSAGGRLLYFLDEGLIGITDQRLPERWSLVARDAFNGKLLWKQPLGEWGWPEWASQKFAGKDWTEITGGRTAVPDENQRRLVAEGDRVYATLAYQAPLSILDAATGQVLATVEETSPAREIVVADGIAVVASKEFVSGQARRRGAQDTSSTVLVGVKGETGDVLWRKDATQIKGLFLVCDQGRVIYQDGNSLVCLSQRTGEPLWQVEPIEKKGKTLIAHDGLVLIRGGNTLEVRDGANGELLWQKQVLAAGGGFEGQDVYVMDGVIWPGMISVTDEGEQTGKSAHVLVIGYDLRTGEETKRISVRNLRSPEHHHRCYRNKATSRYLISSMEGLEFVDLQGDGHAQHNWLRGACKLGIMPANGLLYVPTDQCFCQPGAKLLGFAAVSSEPVAIRDVPDRRRLERGEAYGSAESPHEVAAPDDWPTYRHDAARHGSTPAAVPAEVAPAWRVELGGGLTQPIAAGNRVYVASRDAHTIHALDAETGRSAWSFVAGGRIDSPPTLWRGRLLFGGADGYVYCLRAEDGALVWRFLAAPVDRRIACFDQIESVWPVHGSVLVREPPNGSGDPVAYFAAGRSTYVDGGIRLYGLDPVTGKILHKTTLEGPFPELPSSRDVSFYVLGANSEILVSEGDTLYMRQKGFTPQLEPVEPPVLSTKGEADVGLHIFSTSGLLDGSWYNRTFWMYSKRWPGFQLANQAPKAGQLLVVDDENTFGVKVFYRRNVHSTMFFPGKEGYLVFADRNTTEPQIVGEEGARTPLEWLPQSGYARREGERTLDSPAFGLDKMIGYTRADPPLWAQWLPVRVQAMVKAGDLLFVAGPPDEFDPEDPYAPFEGQKGARLVALSAKDGARLAESELDALPVFDGLIATEGRLLVALQDGSLVCLRR
jgi:outer membrane protein assembly factor BamB